MKLREDCFMSFKESTQNIVAVLDDLIYNYLEECEFSEFANCENVFIIRSANMVNFKKLVSDLQEANAQVFIYVLTHKINEQAVVEICGRNCEVVPFSGSSNYTIDFMSEQIDYLKSKKIDKFIAMLNNVSAIGLNIDEIMINISKENIYYYDIFQSLKRVKEPVLKYKSSVLYNSLCDWFWDYQEYI